jgi:Ca2+:H+ antiporter
MAALSRFGTACASCGRIIKCRMAAHSHDSLPAWTIGAPLAAAALLAVDFAGVLAIGSGAGLVAGAVLLGAAVFASVHHAEVLALKLGEPFGSLLLAVAVTVIEVALIVSMMLTGAPGSEAVARDTVFAAVMIVLNGIVGVCLVLGARRHFEQSFRLEAASAALAVLGTLAVLTLVLPNFTIAVPGPHYSAVQLVFVGLASLVLYGVFVFVQTIRHRDYFLDLPDDDVADLALPDIRKPPGHVVQASLVLLLVSLVGVVLLAKALSKPLDGAVAAVGLPKAFVGVVIAFVVLLPEGIAAVRAAVLNRLQNAMNLALGSAIASIGLTVPVVAAVSLAFDLRLALGLSPENVVLLVLTLFVGTLTLGTGKTTVLQGVVHLVIFAVFLLIAAAP